MATYKEIFNLSRDYFKVFMEEIVGLQNAPFHNELDDNLQNPIHKKIVITYPRGSGKSTHVSVGLPLWLMAKDHNIRILLISNTSTISEKFLSEIMGHIERNPSFKLFAQYVDQKKGEGLVPRKRGNTKAISDWSGSSFTVDRDDLRMKDPTINAVGLFGSILATRADVIIMDDVVNQENSATEAQRLKVVDWVRTTVLPVLVPGGKFIYLGNTWHNGDLVSTLLKDPQFDYRNRVASIQSEPVHTELWQEWANLLLDESKSVEDRKVNAELFYQERKATMEEGVKVLWPERFPYRDLYLLRLSDGYSFARMYQCDPSNRPDQKFKEEWLERAVKRGATLRLQDEPRTGVEMEITTMGLDLAISEKETADDNSLFTLDKVRFGNEILKAGDYVIRNIKVGKFSPNTVREMVKKDNDYIKPMGIRVESVGYQEAMVRDLGESGIPVHGYHTGGEKHDPSIGVNSLAILAELGKLVIPYDPTDARTIQICSRLLNEMRAFPDGHTGDILMSWWFAYSEMRDLVGAQYVIPSMSKNVDPPNIHEPVTRKELEKKADMAVILEQTYERQMLRRMMGK